MPMHDEMVTPEALDQDYLYALYQSAYMDCIRDSDGDVVITEGGLACLVAVPKSGDLIHLVILFPLKKDVPRQKILECVNEINDDYIISRASVSSMKPDILCVDYYIFLNGGVSTRAVVLGTKKFIEVTGQAILEHAKDIAV